MQAIPNQRLREVPRKLTITHIDAPEAPDDPQRIE
jgi:hypothetical protein